MPAATTLLITSDPALVKAVEGVTSSVGHLGLVVVPDADQAVTCLRQENIALVLAHLVRGADPAEVVGLLHTITAAGQAVATVVLSDEYQAEQALALLRQGAANYLDRPLDLGRLTYLVDILTVRARTGGLRIAPATLPLPEPAPDAGEVNSFFYTHSPATAQLLEQVRRVAPQETTILLTGETGTGKTRLAQMIHELSPRSNEPFLAVDCGALSGNLIESEMFGHVKGAFTGADRPRTGKFADVGRGTLLLDEIDALSLVLQTKLLRAVDQRVFEPVGANKSQPMQARLVVASNRCLEEEVAAGRFRQDLYFRLNVVAFYLPPLRDRPGSIRPLANRFAAELAARNGRHLHGITEEAMRALERYAWPGNIRELRNVIERAVALCPGPEIGLGDLPDAVRRTETRGEELALSRPHLFTPPASPTTLAARREEAEFARLTEVLQKHGRNRKQAAVELGISRTALYNKLHKYGLERLNAISRERRKGA